ncbi:Lrp/AsnC family transcriptional regulator [Candidatus Thioglobus sp.]|jgi:Lrp/AsnC family transcriptional regulator|uniref:Lrp/AsnC family transcriptional regulator n=1 Tax=Candidatus Thioglobus sp. TaxID=2026721 RepID=UPI001D453F8D|nr:Lrp/AsnC family transcriptional regulator [Candidatus Thioglobus sp.]MBT3277532.1 Lrp/AsnC family transcriptional regulator [Candidatus Thioglobus sp.]MBT3446786.1 Lrp/AsnC family transcriptional regulator [Candidatus Thioglobus sp.]MBT3745258.1 Lrp/AsnC family transcriptional regulator [Candidatus Thioglobus sp.]MBT4001226.1 Lrp/AsnC family transcriptional regulator [Candidatus Thioglobus sp.]MBT4181455.1 Lrp/AsnC family transcriptional regulator [Candidatus Thioglobus sp.]
MDKTDIQILNLLQKNADLTIQDISKSVYLSTTPCWKRINKLKSMGFIQKTVAILDPKKTNLNTIAFVFVTIESHDQEKLALFSRVVERMPEIVECHRMSGTIDYLLKVIIKDIESYDLFYKKLINKVSFLKVTSNFVLEKIKQTSEIPIMGSIDIT